MENQKNDFHQFAVDDWQTAILLSGENWEAYATGYLRGAQVLVDTALQGTHIDTLVYPFVFLCRHYLELKLKGIILLQHKILQEDLTLRTTHNLSELWKEVNRLSLKIFPKLLHEELSDCGVRIHQIESIDPSSTLYRYPVGTKGELSVPENRPLDLPSLWNSMLAVAQSLEGLASMMRERLDDANELAYYIEDEAQKFQLDEFETNYVRPAQEEWE